MKKSSFEYAALLAVLITFLFFLPHLLLGKIPFPADAQTGLYHPFRDAELDGFAPQMFPTKNPLITDPILQTYPWRHLVVTNLKEGQWPLWNPYSFSGQPLLANIQSSPFIATNILFFILPFNLAWGLQIILPSLLTTLFMYLYLRDLKLSKVASVLGGVTLPFSGFFISWLSWGSIVATVMWLPLILLGISKIAKKVSALWFLILTFSVSQVILSGHWQAGAYVLLASAIYIILKFKNRIKMGIVTGALALGVLISAVLILPAMEMLELSARDVDQGYYPGREDWFIPYEHLIQLISPDFFGNPTTYNYWGVFNYGEFVTFAGIVPLSLCLLALIKRSANISYFIILGAFALILGLENPLSKIPYNLDFPFISSAQPSRIIVLLNFAIAGMAGFGLDSFLKDKSRIKNLIPLILILLPLFLLLALTFWEFFPQDSAIDTQNVARRNLVIPIATAITVTIIFALNTLKVSQKVIVGLVFLVAVFELFRFGYKYISFSKISWIFPQTKTTEFLQTSEKPYRIMTTDRRIMHPNISSVYGIESADGYDPLYLLSYNQLVSSWQSNRADSKPSAYNRIVTPQKYDSPIANLLNIKYILTFDQIANPNFKLVHEEGQTKVYENLKVLPRAYFVQEVVKVSSEGEELSRLLDVNFDPATTAVSQELNLPKIESIGNVTIVSYQDQELTITTSSDQQAPLVLANVYYPGWYAYVDGQKTDIHKVNYLLQSVVVPGGEHTVEFKFRPKSFYNGLYISLVATIITGAPAIILWRKKYQ